MNRDLPLLLSTWLDNPLMCSSRYATTAAAVLAGRLDIRSIQSEFGRMERELMAELATGAKIDADAKRAEWKSKSNVFAADDIAVIQIYGALTRTWGVGPYSGATGYDGILMQLEDAQADDSIKGIWLDINSGGGTINGLFDLADQIFLMRAKNKVFNKPIWAMAADYAYSAAFVIGSSADKFFVGPTGGVGSAGTITMHVSYRRANEEEGIDVNVLRYPEDKAKATEFEDLDDDTREHIMGQLKAITDVMHEKLARNLGISKSAVAATKGLDYMGATAKAIGFVSDVIPESLAWEKFKRYLSRR